MSRALREGGVDACRYHELAGILPNVIASAQISLGEAVGEQHEQTAALLADAYSLASDLCSRLHDDALAWVTAERARSAAQASGDPASIAEAARMASIAMRRHGHHDTATTLLTTTALDLGADSGAGTRSVGHLRLPALHRCLYRRAARQPTPGAGADRRG